jgi:hypothetical protein
MIAEGSIYRRDCASDLRVLGELGGLCIPGGNDRRAIIFLAVIILFAVSTGSGKSEPARVERGGMDRFLFLPPDAGMNFGYPTVTNNQGVEGQSRSS